MDKSDMISMPVFYCKEREGRMDDDAVEGEGRYVGGLGVGVYWVV
jgi:hypothetical protein